MSVNTFAPRRRIEQRHPATGRMIGYFETTVTDAELAEQDRQTAARREALAAQGLAATLAARREEQARREALAGVGADADAREHLRDAHRALAEARDDLARRREVAAGADRHVAASEAAHDRAKQAVAMIADRAAAAIVEQLERGQPPTSPTPTRAAADRAGAARIDLEHAMAAQAEVTALANRAAETVTKAEAAVKEAARGVIRLQVSELRAEMDALSAQLAEHRDRLNALLPCVAERPWPVAWPAAAAALLADREAVLYPNEEAETSASGDDRAGSAT